MERNSFVETELEEHQQNKQLTSSELADLFSNYLGDTLFCCMFEHYLQVVEDDEIKDYIEFSLALSRRHVKEVQGIFKMENIPVPVGFGEQDVRKDAPRIFSDMFMVFYIVQMASAALLTYGNAYSCSTRQDTMNYFRNSMNDSAETYERGVHLLLLKGVDISPPTIPYAKKVDFVEKKSFISIITGRDRPLTANEIKHLQYNINTNILGKSLMLGFSQVASSEKIRKYFQKGAELAGNQIQSFSEHLTSQDLPAPMLMAAHITDSTTSPFSDKLMMYHCSLAGNIAVQNFGAALSQMLRHDLAAEFIKLIPLIGKFNNDGLNMMIELGWFEEPFTAPDRKELSKSSQGNQM
ncbi:hypothetical protein WQ54_09450 [Bacillus sp. SA1-12]|uniref:DUF3231 family protein n=1 Tax=Bacillus sp. SA1-12 TaxID=1455638 RepID=UPI000626BFB9|nr:DUF3231 family protein [Bacillus sp. SA1-12]KKI92391.1 hypothetical protein WQ54_09450 [Bacillus sp. SA1-12]